MKKTNKSLFSNGTEFTSWTFRNCDNCVKQSHYNEKKDTYSAFKCSIDRDISMQQIFDDPVNLKSWETTQLRDCPYIQTERKVSKKRIIKNQFSLDL
jgi:hypothetical protein